MSDLRGKRMPLALLALTTVVVLMVSATAGAAPAGTYRADSEGYAGTIAFRLLDPEEPPGVTGGLSITRVSSDPLARSRGAGSCQSAPALGQDLFELECTAANTEAAQVTAPGEDDPTPEAPVCSTPASPDPALILGTFCGDALARIVGADPFAFGRGTLGDAEIDLIPQLDGKDVVVMLGSTTSRSGIGEGFSEDPTIRALAQGSAGAVGLACRPILTPQGEEVEPRQVDLDTCTVLIQIGASSAEATWDGAVANATALAPPVSVKIEDTTVTVPPGTSQTFLPGTLLQTTVAVAAPSTTIDNESTPKTAVALSEGFTLHGIQGAGGTANAEGECDGFDCDGGVLVQSAYTRASVEGTPAPIITTTTTLAVTGPGVGANPWLVGLLLLLGGLWMASLLRRGPRRT